MKTPLGDATEVSTRVFIDDLLPPLHADFKLDALFEDPASCGKKALPVTKNGRLYGYCMKTPSVLKTRKAAAFKGLQICAGRLIRAIGIAHPCVHLRNNEVSQWSLKKRSENALPDAYFLFQDQAYGRVDWTNIAIPGVYHKLKTSATSKENVVKIAHCLSQCMHRDARRRFMYGFTVEDSTMRLFYCDRNKIVCSGSFDFITEWSTLFEFWLRVLLAAPDELGLDPSMELLDDQANKQYDIKVRAESGEEQTYRTTELLADPNPKKVASKGTRVWKVFKVENGETVGEPAVLKDCWVNVLRTREGAINASIRASATDDEQKEGLERALLSVLTHGDVYVGQAPDVTKCLPKELGEGTGQDVHYRIVHKEVCQPLDLVTSLFTVFKALGDACNCLRFLHGCGWVHRDVSVGNILIFEDFVKIADLEYAERVENIVDHKDRFFGTHFFMAVEAKIGRYLFLPQDPVMESVYPPGYDCERYMRENRERMKRGEPLIALIEVPPSVPRDRRPFPSFRYNPVHDLESLWWIAAFFLVHQLPPSDAEHEEDMQGSRVQRQLARDFFWTGSRRLDVLRAIDGFGENTDCLHHSVHDTTAIIDNALQYLIRGYRTKEASLRDDPLKFDDRVHRDLVDSFYSAAKGLDGPKKDILVRSLEYKLVSS